MQLLYRELPHDISFFWIRDDASWLPQPAPGGFVQECILGIEEIKDVKPHIGNAEAAEDAVAIENVTAIHAVKVKADNLARKHVHWTGSE